MTKDKFIIVEASVVEETRRPELLRLMGYPSLIDDNEYDQETVAPDWEAVLEQLYVNPSEASYMEDGAYPLDDALWIESDPVPLDVVIRLLRINPAALSEKSYAIANDNPNTCPEVLRILRAADVDSHFTGKRTELLILMGFPSLIGDNDYEVDDIEPDWNAVRKRLVTHSGEAKVHEYECYPLADALSIEWDPVPLDVVASLIRLAPESLTDEAFQNASGNEELESDILEYLFKADRNGNLTRLAEI